AGKLFELLATAGDFNLVFQNLFGGHFRPGAVQFFDGRGGPGRWIFSLLLALPHSIAHNSPADEYYHQCKTKRSHFLHKKAPFLLIESYVPLVPPAKKYTRFIGKVRASCYNLIL